MPNVVELIRTQLATEPAESKKYRMVAHGMWNVIAVFCFASVLCYLKPEIAGNIASLAQMVVTALGGLVSVYAGAQAVVEYKANSVLQTNQQNVTQSPSGQPCPPTTQPPVVTQGATGAPAQPPFTPAAVVP